MMRRMMMRMMMRMTPWHWRHSWSRTGGRSQSDTPDMKMMMIVIMMMIMTIMIFTSSSLSVHLSSLISWHTWHDSDDSDDDDSDNDDCDDDDYLLRHSLTFLHQDLLTCLVLFCPDQWGERLRILTNQRIRIMLTNQRPGSCWPMRRETENIDQSEARSIPALLPIHGVAQLLVDQVAILK